MKRNISILLAELKKENGAEVLTIFCGQSGQLAAKKYAAVMQLPCYPDVLNFELVDGKLHILRKVYSTHMEGLFPMEGNAVVIMAAGTEPQAAVEMMGAAGLTGIRHAELTDLYALMDSDSLVEEPSGLLHTEKMIKTEDLASARLVLLGGKGLGSKANFQRLEALASKLGASCGCTRPVAMAGWAAYDKVVGLSGSILSAEVCIAFGVSGAGPLMAGASGAARLVAVNNDPKAPIFSQCSDGLVADCLEILEAMEEAAEEAAEA